MGTGLGTSRIVPAVGNGVGVAGSEADSEEPQAVQNMSRAIMRRFIRGLYHMEQAAQFEAGCQPCCNCLQDALRSPTIDGRA